MKIYMAHTKMCSQTCPKQPLFARMQNVHEYSTVSSTVYVYGFNKLVVTEAFCSPTPLLCDEQTAQLATEIIMKLFELNTARVKVQYQAQRHVHVQSLQVSVS